MRKHKISETIGQIDTVFIEEAGTYTAKKQATRPAVWVKWGAIAACFAVLAVAGAAFLPSFFGGEKTPNVTSDRYKDHLIQTENVGILWRWEDQTVYEKYNLLTLDGVEYTGSGRAVSTNLVDERLGTHTVVGYDDIVNEKHTETFEVYQLKYADKSRLVAVKMDTVYYVFKKEAYAPPHTLGELFTLVNIPQAVTLNRFSENGDSPSGKHFALNNDDYVWRVLAECEKAPFIEDTRWMAHDREYISFTVTSETLGVYKVAMYVTADGYLWTNMFHYQYLFDIGEEAAGKIIKYAKENATAVEYEPYQNTIAGEIIEITDDYILVNDSVLCNDPKDGITYTVLLNDIRISRYVDRKLVRVGDTVQVAYDGEIDRQNTNTIRAAKTIEEVSICFEIEEDAPSSDNGTEVTTVTTRTSAAHVPA